MSFSACSSDLSISLGLLLSLGSQYLLLIFSCTLFLKQAESSVLDMLFSSEWGCSAVSNLLDFFPFSYFLNRPTYLSIYYCFINYKNCRHYLLCAVASFLFISRNSTARHLMMWYFQLGFLGARINLLIKLLCRVCQWKRNAQGLRAHSATTILISNCTPALTRLKYTNSTTWVI